MGDYNKKKYPNIAAETGQRIQKEVEGMLSFKLRTPRDFAEASRVINNVTNRYLSPSTLKRFWGYQKNYEGKPCRFTLDTLATFLGFADYENYLTADHSVDFSSRFNAEFLKRIEALESRLSIVENKLDNK